MKSRLGLGRGFLGGSLSAGLDAGQAAAVCLALTVGALFTVLRAPNGLPPLSLGLFFTIGYPPVGLPRPPLGLFAQKLCALKGSIVSAAEGDTEAAQRAKSMARRLLDERRKR